MKVVIDAQQVCTRNFRGVPNYTLQLIKALLRRNNNEYALAFFDGNRERKNRETHIEPSFGEFNVQYYECNSISYITVIQDRDVYKYKSYNEFTGASGDVFHFPDPYHMPGNIQGQVVVTVHDVIIQKIPEFHSYAQPAVEYQNKLRQGDQLIIANSEFTKKDFAELTGISENRIFVTPLGYDNSSVYPEKNREALADIGVTKPYLLYLGAFSLNKGIKNILSMFEHIASRYSDIELVLAGTLEFGDITILSDILRNPYRNRIITPGFVSDDAKRILMSNALVFIFPSLYEGFGLPVLEAMACGCPVITSNTTSLPEVAGDACVLIDPTDTEELISETERLIQSEESRLLLSDKGITRARGFSWDKTAAVTEDVYLKAISR